MNIGCLATCAEASEPVASGALVFEDERIVFAGAAQHAPLDGVENVWDAEGRLVTPGLIDSHTHLVFAGNRANEFAMRASGATYEEIAAAGGGIRSSVRAMREASDDTLLATARRNLVWMLSCGTTALEAKTGYGLSLDHELRALKVAQQLERESGVAIHRTWLGLHAVPPEFEGRREAYVNAALEEIAPELAASGLVQWADAFIESNYFTHDDARRLAQVAKQHGWGLRLHVDQLTENGGATLATELGAASADHLEQTGEAGIRALAQSETFAGLLPTSVFALGKHKYPDARAMLDAGVKVVLASDFNPGSSPSPSLPFAMSLACTQMRMTPMEALIACTRSAAASLGWTTERGTLETGKRADFVVWDAQDAKEIPYWIGTPLVKRTVVGGRVAFER